MVLFGDSLKRQYLINKYILSEPCHYKLNAKH